MAKASFDAEGMLTVPPQPERAVEGLKTPWWHTHSSAASVLLVAGVTSALYFFGSRRLDTLAKEFGLAGTPRSMGLQEVMVAGVDVLQLPVMCTVLVSALVLYLGVKAVVRFQQFIISKSGTLREHAAEVTDRFRALQSREHSTVEALELDEMDRALSLVQKRLKRFNMLLVASNLLRKLGKLSTFVIGSLTVAIVLGSGILTGKLDAWIIRYDVSTDCSECFVYKTPNRTVLASPIFQSDDNIVAYRRQGVVIIPLSGDLLITTQSEPKKAGHLKGTQKPTGTIKPPQAPASPRVGSPNG